MMSWRDEMRGERAAWNGPRYDREHEDRIERARRAYSYSDPDRAYQRGYEEEIERQKRDAERREAERREAERRLHEEAEHMRLHEYAQWGDDEGEISVVGTPRREHER